MDHNHTARQFLEAHLTQTVNVAECRRMRHVYPPQPGTSLKGFLDWKCSRLCTLHTNAFEEKMKKAPYGR